MSVALETHPEGVILPIRAQPGSRANAVRGVQAAALKVAVTQVAEKGKANDALLDVVCEALELRRGQVELLSGQLGRQKRLLVRGITLAELQQRIERVLAS